jgi:phosphomevalonate kinase
MIENTTRGPGASVSVPGKLFLAGEYAVLDGAPAILAAAGRTATGTYVPGLAPATPLIASAQVAAATALRERGLLLPPGAARVDTGTFAQRGIKLGLGSSAAAAVAAVGAAFAHAGLAIEDEPTLLRATADTAHRAAQAGVGSGADVAASVFGGFLRFVRAAAGDAQEGDVQGVAAVESVEVTPIQPPADLHFVTFWTRAAARTTGFIAGVDRFRRQSPQAHAQRLGDLRAAAIGFDRAFAISAQAAINAAADCYTALAALGTDAGLPIVIPAAADAAALAQTLGGAAKPSGAGGGDMGIAFFADKDAVAAFVARCPAEVLVLEIPLGVAGARTSAAPSSS